MYAERNDVPDRAWSLIPRRSAPPHLPLIYDPQPALFLASKPCLWTLARHVHSLQVKPLHASSISIWLQRIHASHCSPTDASRVGAWVALARLGESGRHKLKRIRGCSESAVAFCKKHGMNFTVEEVQVSEVIQTVANYLCPPAPPPSLPPKSAGVFRVSPGAEPPPRRRPPGITRRTSAGTATRMMGTVASPTGPPGGLAQSKQRLFLGRFRAGFRGSRQPVRGRDAHDWVGR